MNLILTGIAGFIDVGVLQQCFARPTIAAIIVLSRRPLDSIPHSRLRVVVVDHFSVYEGLCA